MSIVALREALVCPDAEAVTVVVFVAPVGAPDFELTVRVEVPFPPGARLKEVGRRLDALKFALLVSTTARLKVVFKQPAVSLLTRVTV
jgi:hypothetical protein